MDIFIGIVLAIATFAATAYVHRKISAFTNSRSKASFTRVLLIVVGAAFGAVSSMYVIGSLQKVITFLAAFGMVHVPAAIILMIKARRGERRS